MNQDKQDMLYDLLSKKAVYGLDDEEQRQLDELDAASANREFKSLEITAAAINMAGLSAEEPLPEHLYSKIAADAAKWVGTEERSSSSADEPWPPVRTGREIFADAEPPRRSMFGWLGWVAAAAACIALAANIWMTRFQPDDIVKVQPTPVASPQPMKPSEMLAQFENSTPNLVRANWAPGNVKDIKELTGEIVWSDDKQQGFIHLRGLPVNDATTTCYQLWIFDKVQDKATPLDGGIFDVSQDAEVVIPVTTKVKAEGPTMFALTIERHGGVVVSKRAQIAAIAKVSNS